MCSSVVPMLFIPRCRRGSARPGRRRLVLQRLDVRRKIHNLLFREQALETGHHRRIARNNFCIWLQDRLTDVVVIRLDCRSVGKLYLRTVKSVVRWAAAFAVRKVASLTSKFGLDLLTPNNGAPRSA